MILIIKVNEAIAPITAYTSSTSHLQTLRNQSTEWNMQWLLMNIVVLSEIVCRLKSRTDIELQVK